MSVIRATVTDQVLKITEAPLVASGGQNELKVAFTFCEKWDGFAKTATFYRDEDNVYHSELDENNTCIVPWEVYYESGTFYFGVFGKKDDVRRTSSTARYRVKKGAVSDETMPPDPAPGVYEQIMKKLGELEQNIASAVEDYMAEHPIEGGSDGVSATHSWNGTVLTITSASGTSSADLKGADGKDGQNGSDYVLTDADKEEIAEQAAQMVEIPQEAGITDAEKNLILSLFRNAAYTSDAMGNTLTQLEALWSGSDEPIIPDVPEPEVTLTSISAVYSGGDVAAGTAVNSLTGVAVTAHYSDGSTQTVTGYTLSGTIAEGSNTVTVTYQGKTATFTVTGVPEPGVTLTSISATYSGGEVPIGTAVNSLTGVVVTAHYSNGTTATVVGYTLSGAIAEGNNTITVAYEGKTATFVVVGVAESGGGSAAVNLYEREGEYLVGDPTDVVWGDNSLTYTSGTNETGVFTHVKLDKLEIGKTYTLFWDASSWEDKAQFIRQQHRTTASPGNAATTSFMGTIGTQASFFPPESGGKDYRNHHCTFTIPEDILYLNLAFATRGTGVTGTFQNIAIYEGELTERP